MLVLSRKPQETIVFPHLGISLEIVRVSGRTVSVGVKAPSCVKVLRGEITERSDYMQHDEPTAGRKSELANLWQHQRRNRMHTVRLGLKLLEKQFAAGMFESAEQTLGDVIRLFQQFDEELGRTETDGMSAVKVVGESIGECAEVATPSRCALVVEDDSNESELLAGILRLSGYQVTTAGDGIEALELLKDRRPDFVLLDMNMPRCDGPTMLAAIRANPDWRGLKVFAVSGCSQGEAGINAEGPGVDKWFQKPLDPELLLRAMSHARHAACVSA